MMALLCLALYFFGSEQNLPDTKFLRPFGYCCLGFTRKWKKLDAETVVLAVLFVLLTLHCIVLYVLPFFSNIYGLYFYLPKSIRVQVAQVSAARTKPTR